MTRTEGGSYRVGFSYGESQIDDIIFSGGGCDSPDPAVAQPVRYRARSFGANAVAWTSRTLRFGLAGSITSADTSALKGGQLKGVVAGEWKSIGIGTGFVLDNYDQMPGLYLRFGSLNSVHARFDWPDVSWPTSNTGVGRFGVGYNLGRERGFGAFIGIPLCYVNCRYEEGGVRADARVPIGSAFDLGVSAFRRNDDEGKEFWGVAAMGSFQRR